MATKKTDAGSGSQDDKMMPIVAATMMPIVAATLAGVVYQSRLLNRQAKLNIPDHEVVTDVVNTFYAVKEALAKGKK
jgi:hypothetical protein